MADDGITFDGKPLLIHFNGLDFSVNDWLRDWLPRSPAECPPKALVDDRKDSVRQSSYRSPRPLPVPNYPPVPPIGINQLYWPTGAARWARGYFLADNSTATAIRNSCYGESNSPKILRVAYGGQSISVSMYALPPEPITSAASDGLYVIPLVDARYWWQMSSIFKIELERGDTWQDVFDNLIGFGTTVFPTADAAYLTPDSVELTRRYDNIAMIMDAVAHSLGLRVVRDPNGTTRFMQLTDSLARFITNSGAYKLIAGAARLAGPTPETLSVAFQRLVAGAVDCGDEWISGGNTTGIKTTGVVDTIHSAAFASFAESGDSTPANYTALKALSDKIVADYFAYQRATEFDMTLAGIHSWQPTGFDDYMLFTFVAENEPELRIVGQGGDDGTPLEIESRTAPKGPFVRVRSMPKNFGTVHQLSQDPDVVEVKEPFFRLINHSGKDHLLPGSWAYFEYVERTDIESDWNPTVPQLIVKIYDPNHFAFTLKGEVIKAAYSCKRHRWETVSESGLSREMKPVSTIANKATGSCDVWVNETITSSPKVTLTGVYVGWLFGTENAPAGAKSLGQYFRNSGGAEPRGQWKLVNRACE